MMMSVKEIDRQYSTFQSDCYWEVQYGVQEIISYFFLINIYLEYAFHLC